VSQTHIKGRGRVEYGATAWNQNSGCIRHMGGGVQQVDLYAIVGEKEREEMAWSPWPCCARVRTATRDEKEASPTKGGAGFLASQGVTFSRHRCSHAGGRGLGQPHPRSPDCRAGHHSPPWSWGLLAVTCCILDCAARKLSARACDAKEEPPPAV